MPEDQSKYFVPSKVILTPYLIISIDIWINSCLLSCVLSIFTENSWNFPPDLIIVIMIKHCLFFLWYLQFHRNQISYLRLTPSHSHIKLPVKNKLFLHTWNPWYSTTLPTVHYDHDHSAVCIWKSELVISIKYWSMQKTLFCWLKVLKWTR